MRQTDLWRPEKPGSYLSRNCFKLFVKSITAFVTLLASRFLTGCNWRDGAYNYDFENARFELALVQWLVLRHELPDQHVLDHRITASYGLIAPLVTMSCRVLLRRAASRGVLPRERFRPLGAKRKSAPALIYVCKPADVVGNFA